MTYVHMFKTSSLKIKANFHVVFHKYLNYF